ncbi:MAG: glycosyltransferase family 2 protein [Chlorobi bacterium]|nr:glycosyltransferase family 2 protein [Chlorobiota bacterium]
MTEPVSIIMLNYNGKQYLKDSISSVLSQSYKDFELIIFDNASTDGSVEFIKNSFNDSRIKIIESEINFGFAWGNNSALKNCPNDLIVLLNNDTKAEKEWLYHLIQVMNEPKTIGSSFVITEGVPEKYYISNGSVSYLMYNIMNVFENTEDEFYPNGCSIIFRKSEIREPFDNDYFYYSEDVYLGLKARFMGIKIKFVKKSVVHHYGGGSKSLNREKTFYQERNRLLNLYLFFSPGFIIRVLPYVAFNHNFKLLISFFSGKYSLIGLLKAYLWFYINIPTIIKKRKALKKFKTVKEKDVVKFISSKVFNDESLIEKTINRISYLYSRIAGIKPVEFYQKNKLPLN